MVSGTRFPGNGIADLTQPLVALAILSQSSIRHQTGVKRTVGPVVKFVTQWCIHLPFSHLLHFLENLARFWIRFGSIG